MFEELPFGLITDNLATVQTFGEPFQASLWKIWVFSVRFIERLGFLQKQALLSVIDS